ncbi:DNA recombination protein RecO [Candidatus Francisella endociliophora]|uniref:DNA repair protein RecO n=1 Tax=Candidatus Francisella endociliophora TaxID=653937 RepID=A0A097EN69_9GAMM|nr:DNA repair protein RecO [Francisella sp. FSC1006]AIT09011.1 DNA recombination protein RecO [Francisella sp. FSC1006]
MKEQLYNFYILHQRKYKENSLLLSVFTRELGKVSVIVRTNKKTVNLYQPLVELRGQISVAKKADSLSKLYNVEFVASCYQKSYINLLSLQYANELLYMLLSHSHEEDILFSKYDFLLKNIDENNYKYLLRMFELELLESLGQGIYVDCDVDGVPIDSGFRYVVLNNDFKKCLNAELNTISGASLLKINQSISAWSETDLKEISKVVRAFVDYVLAGKQLKSRKLLIDYLSLKK